MTPPYEVNRISSPLSNEAFPVEGLYGVRMIASVRNALAVGPADRKDILILSSCNVIAPLLY